MASEEVVVSMVHIKQASLATVLIALGVVIAPFLSFPVLESKAYPGQHLINGLAGVLLGPLWAAFIAFSIGVIRMGLGIGTIFSMPGGIPGGVIVGFFYLILKKMGKQHLELAALTEPLGTIFLGGILAVYVFAPLLNREMFLVPVWIGWSLSCIPGAILSFIVLGALRMAGFMERILE
jgi:energy coupling factor transporter S component ThiW